MRTAFHAIFKIGSSLVLAAFAAGAAVWFRPPTLDLFVDKFMIQLCLEQPEYLTSLGLVDNTPLDFHSHRLNSYTQEADDRILQLLRDAREDLDRYGPEGLDECQKTTWSTIACYLNDRIALAELDPVGYRVNPISGVTIDLPQFLTDSHKITDKASAMRYVQRLWEFGRVLQEVLIRTEDDIQNGVLPPDFVAEKTLVGLRTFTAQDPDNHSLVTHLRKRLKELQLPAVSSEAIEQSAKKALAEAILPGYQSLISLFEKIQPLCRHEASIAMQPNGLAIYDALVRSETSCDLSPEAIHEIGVFEVGRIEHEMSQALHALGYSGESPGRTLALLAEDPQYLFPDSDAGREQMFAYLRAIEEKAFSRSSKIFKRRPHQDLEIVRVPMVAEESAPGGFYIQPALDGSRPGRFYINQKNMRGLPKWGLPTLMVHEGSPGHHFQLSIAQTIPHLPLLRRTLSFTAYAEGWALYAEKLASTHLGLYEDDPMGELGRLQAEILRAVRLVVDTGIHAKQWTREQAISYMRQHTGRGLDEVTREVERYCIWPAQALAYKIGEITLYQLREHCQTQLGAAFDIASFHEKVLSLGSVPLPVLAESLQRWCQAAAASGLEGSESRNSGR